MRITPFSWVLRKFHKDFFLLYRYIYWVAIYHMHLLTSILCIATKYKYLMYDCVSMISISNHIFVRNSTRDVN